MFPLATTGILTSFLYKIIENENKTGSASLPFALKHVALAREGDRKEKAPFGAYLTALICSQSASPLRCPFCSLVRP